MAILGRLILAVVLAVAVRVVQVWWSFAILDRNVERVEQ
jgi:hypothetical protein